MIPVIHLHVLRFVWTLVHHTFRVGTDWGGHSPPLIGLKISLGLATRSYFAVTIAAVNRPITTGLEWYLCFFATFGTYRRVHLAVGTVVAIAAASGTLCLSCLAAIRTTLGFISITLGLVEFLFLSGETEGCSAIGALERLILKTHLGDLLSYKF